jgi:hypothetical protein
MEVRAFQLIATKYQKHNPGIFEMETTIMRISLAL